MLINAGIPYDRELPLGKFDATFDFPIGDNVLCECKVDMRTHQAATCLGQLVRYKSEHEGPIILLLPDDMYLWHHDEPLIKSLCEIVRETKLIEWLKAHNACGDPSNIPDIHRRLQGRMKNVFLFNPKSLLDAIGPE